MENPCSIWQGGSLKNPDKNYLRKVLWRKSRLDCVGMMYRIARKIDQVKTPQDLLYCREEKVTARYFLSDVFFLRKVAREDFPMTLAS